MKYLGSQSDPKDIATKEMSIPEGGTAKQVLQKDSSEDYDVSWVSAVSMAQGIPYGVTGSASTATAFVATVPGITELKNGTCALIQNTSSYSPSAYGASLNVNGLGAKSIVNNYSDQQSMDTVWFSTGRTILFVYSTTGGGTWIAYWGYAKDPPTDSIGYRLRTNDSTRPAADAVYRYKLLFTSADGTKWVPANTENLTNATAARAVNQRPIDPFGDIVYYNSTTSVTSGSNVTSTSIWQQYGTTFGYSFNRTGSALTLTYPAPVYIKCAPQADGSAIMDADTPFVQSLPSTNDGKIYIYLGRAYSATQIELILNHPVYYHDGTGLGLWTGNSAGNDAVTSVAGKTGAVTLVKDDVGLGNVDNTSDATKKTNFTGSIADGNTGFVTGDDAYDALALKLNLSGGTMSGAIAMGSNKITGLGTPTNDGDASTKSYVDTSVSTAISGLGAVLNFKGTVATTSALPTSNMKKGDVYIVTTDNSEYVWTSDSATGTSANYEMLGTTTDLSGYRTAQAQDVIDNQKYEKPSTGIPKTDLASAVQTSLGKADSAYQKPSTGIPSADLASAVQTSLGKADSAYQKPSTGVPSSDLASTVQTSLSKADTAYQKPSGGIPSSDLTTSVQTSLGRADTAYQKPSGGIPSTDLAETYALPANVPASASIDSSGLITFKNSSNSSVFTLQLPLYNGGVV